MTTPLNIPKRSARCSAVGLAEALAAESDFSRRYPGDPASDLQRVSLFIDTDKELGRARLVDYLKGHLRTGKKPSKALRMLSALPFKIIVTTNYDRLLEASLRQHRKEPKVVVYQPDGKAPTEDVKGELSDQEPLVFKMHGDLEDGDSIVITDENYIRFIQRMTDKDPYHPVPETVRYHMKRWPTLFIGYSLRDYNLRLLFRTLRWGVDLADFPKCFALDPKPDPLIMHVWQDREAYIAFVVHDLWKFVPRMYREAMERDFDE